MLDICHTLLWLFILQPSSASYFSKVARQAFNLSSSSELDKPVLLTTTPSPTTLPNPNPSITAPPPYDPDGCRLLWTEYVNSMLSAQLSFVELVQPIMDGVVSPKWTVMEKAWKTYTSTFTSGSGTTWTECDGVPRFQWTSSTLLTNTTVQSLGYYVSGTSTRSPKGLPAEPTCKILPSDCSRQWDAFASWSTQMTGVETNNSISTKGIDFMREYAWQDIGLNARFQQQYYDQDHPDPSNFMGGCKVDEDLCRDVYREQISTNLEFVQSMRYHGLTKEESKQSAYKNAVNDLMRSCRAHVGQFVLIYFPPTESERDICASSKRIARHMENQPETPVMTAAMTAITIGTNTHTGDFRFTSPSLYLAYDSAVVWRGCSRIGATHGPGIMTLLPGDLKSLSYSKVSSYTPPSDYDMLISGWIGTAYTPRVDEYWMPLYDTLNLADFQPPYPSSAWFASNPYCREKLAMNGGSIFASKENCTETIFQTNGPQRPTFAIPDIFTKIDPEWTSCNGAFMNPVNSMLNMFEDGIPDPPIALPTASYLTLPTVTSKASATPHQLPPSPIAKPTKEREFFEIPAPIWKSGFNSPSSTVLDLGTTSIPVTYLGPNIMVAGTNTISANGPAATIHGQIVSLGSGVLFAGSKSIRLNSDPIPAFTARINGEIVTGYKESDGGIVLGPVTLRSGGSALVTGGRTFSMGKTGLMLDGTKLNTGTPAVSTSPSIAKHAVSSSGARSKALVWLGLIGIFALNVVVVFSVFGT